MDSHRIAPGGPLVIGGIRLDVPFHFVGHSDADILLHSITDAILSVAGLEDIGQLFPNTSEENKGRDSAEMLSIAVEKFQESGWSIINLDCVVELERPKLSPHKGRIIARIAEILGVPPERVGVKGKTGEQVGEIGEGRLGKSTCLLLAVQN